MKKYRVKEITYLDGHKEYIIQYKWLCFWIDYKEPGPLLMDDFIVVKYEFLDQAVRKIQKLKKNYLSDTVESSKIVYYG